MVQVLLILAVLLFFLFLSLFFSGLETGLISIDMIALEHSSRRSRRDASLLRFLKQPDKFLGTTLIGNNIANAILASLATLFVAELGEFRFDARYTSLIIGTIVLIFGEIVPKAIFRDYADTIVPRLYPILLFFYYLFRPFVAVVGWINRGLRKMLKLDENNQYDYLTKDDINFLLNESSEDSTMSPQLEMIEDALDLKDMDARNVMVPRTDIVAIPESSSIAEISEIAREEGFTRYPVYRNSIDDIIGVLIIYDILKFQNGEEKCAGDLVHEPFFAPENMDVDILLKEMQLQHKSMTIIVDSYGGTAGIVTIEDILEEIVGEIEDEYDDDGDQDVQQISPNTWIAMADVEIDHLADDHEIELPEGDYETVAGLILDHLEKIPHQGQFITIAPYRIQVLQATDKKIIKVKIHKQNEVKT
ncbi:MAG: hemolysin family protein [Candidatus Cloacimonadaceae bacterium]|jgi:CBS domain containing-hemolysin-like protein|nr:hemolysin family protein [Candidatus Cloacimonadota bacterium]MCK9177545.1 hemolysin family protein [Candidatus Cloacimonadota bacterium]MDD3102792.1 hemolysin family protein [Candidatus Cloacimonadota bacterium]MDD3533041.1 hemolysin family protein [Candidatus Cloacimonadota bacterium]MDY0126521.1 hemolysin family protein [Candidatus Cloacimonadaceae bacterium]